MNKFISLHIWWTKRLTIYVTFTVMFLYNFMAEQFLPVSTYTKDIFKNMNRLKWEDIRCRVFHIKKIWNIYISNIYIRGIDK